MPVPEFFHFIRPTLEVLGDGRVRHWTEMEADLADGLRLDAEARAEMLPSGSRTRVADRIQWALTYLRQAGLIESTGRGRNKITARGSEYLRRAPQVVRPDDLMEFPEFEAFRQRTSKSTPQTPVTNEHSTPDDRIAEAFAEHRAVLLDDLLAAVKGMSAARFEWLIVQLMLKMGYGLGEAAGRVTGGSGDGGIDGVIDEDKLGLDKVYLQAKRWTDTTVGRREVQAFVGALTGHGASKGVFITASQFSHEAEGYAANIKGVTLSLIDGRRLVQLMAEHDLGVTPTHTFVMKRVDSDIFGDG